MLVYSCGNGKYRIGDGECMYTSREHAVSAYFAYLAEENKKIDKANFKNIEDYLNYIKGIDTNK